MSNIETTDVDVGGIQVCCNEQCCDFEDNLITFGGAGTLLRGTILARDSVSLKLVPFVKGGVTNENGIPKAVLTYAVTAEGAGDVKARVLVRGTVNKDRLVIDADGDDSNIDAAVTDKLRDYSIICQPVQQLATPPADVVS